MTGKPLRSARSAYFIIAREEGIFKGLYRGFFANAGATLLQGAFELVTYDVAKHAAIGAGFADSYPVHLGAGMTAGLVATIVSNPLDVVTTRLMAAKRSQNPSAGTWDTIASMWAREGIRSFFKGFGPNVLRIGTFNVIMWAAYEQIRKLGKHSDADVVHADNTGVPPPH